ncbi:NAD(P)-dependent oxidoreductase [Spirochaeta lutea]|uniref:NAD(P)-binding domain-containing protein n=1 Tax=Spirochaeta lutea TaxID=1480694 RepID=A0A098QTD7_9SPIO|nr:NAD(P)-binding oxidoreductase [Spirochaeta lutea]KGE70979.1 hypothetical protein DC28_13675 [Spirochaeta lutea]
MTVLIAGPTGATGQLLVEQLLDRGVGVRAVVRPGSRLPERVTTHKNRELLEVIQGTVLDMDDEELQTHVQGCGGVASCLGHNLTMKGLYGKPRRLVRDSVRKLYRALESPRTQEPVKLVLMNTAGNRHREAGETVSPPEYLVTGLIRMLLPPHADNEQAADVLAREVGTEHPSLEWVVVRPDNLTDQGDVQPYTVHPSPIRSAIFNPGQTSRITVAHFMAELFTDGELWSAWKGRMPVVYNT